MNIHLDFNIQPDIHEIQEYCDFNQFLFASESFYYGQFGICYYTKRYTK